MSLTGTPTPGIPNIVPIGPRRHLGFNPGLIIDPTAPSNAAGSRPRLFHLDDFGADRLGDTDSNQALLDAYGELDGKPGGIIFGVGTYLFHTGLNADVDRLLTPGQGVFGQGVGLTVIDYRGPGSFLEFRDLDFDNPDAPHNHGGCVGLTISGWNSGEDDACGLRFGDLWRPYIDVEIEGFTRPGCKGLWGDNQYRWSERAHIRCVADQCTENFVFESNTGEGYSGSFDYSRYDLSFIAQPNQHGFVLRSGTAGSAVSMNGVELTLTGNCQRGAGNTGEMFRVGKDNADEAGFSGTLNIGVETSGSTGESHFDFMMGDGPSWEVQSRVSATGAINLIPFSGADFQKGSATPQTFAFAGLLKNSPALGSTGTVQAFQPLQLLSQARGNWYLDSTDCVQVLYITKATGGTFPLGYGGDTTPTQLAHNATAAQVETALRALPSVGANVWVYAGQPRFVNGVAQDEHAYILWFGGALGSADLPLVTTSAASLTGTGHAAEVVTKAPGSPHGTYVIPLEQGNIFRIDPAAGTYRLRSAVGGLTKMSAFGDSPFGVTTVDIWIRQPDTGGPAIFEAPWFVPEALSGSSYHFEWMDGQTPTLSTTPGAFDIIRLTSYNFSTWIGQHITKRSPIIYRGDWDSGTAYKVGDVVRANGSLWRLYDDHGSSTVNVFPSSNLTWWQVYLPGGGDAIPLDVATAAVTHSAASKTTPADADEFPGIDSADDWKRKRFPWSGIKSALLSLIPAATMTFVNKTMSGSSNTFSNIPVSAIAASGFSVATIEFATVSTAVTLGAVAGREYVTLLNSGAATTLPTAVGNASKYTFHNCHTAGIGIPTTSGQTIAGLTGFVLPPGASITVVSDNSNWRPL